MDYNEYCRQIRQNRALLDELATAQTNTDGRQNRQRLLQQQKKAVLENISLVRKKAVEDKVFHAKYGELFEELKKQWKKQAQNSGRCSFSLMPFKDNSQPEKPFYYLEFEVHRPYLGHETFSTFAEFSQAEKLTDATIFPLCLMNDIFEDAFESIAKRNLQKTAPASPSKTESGKSMN